MKKILYILFVLLFVGCELSMPEEPSNPDTGKPGDGDVPGSPLPSQPIKRRPITPQDKIKRPRLTIISEKSIELRIDGIYATNCCSVSLRSDSTGEEYIVLMGEDMVVTLPIMDDSSDYTLRIEGDGVSYVEKFTIL